MLQCPGCAKHMMRVHRSLMQKALYSDIFRCTRCDRRLNRVRPIVSATALFTFARHSHCIRCSTPDVERLKKRDRVDSLSHHPASILLALTGAPFNRCSACRLQFHDWRHPA
jgi:hypothetical protein